MKELLQGMMVFSGPHSLAYKTTKFVNKSYKFIIFHIQHQIHRGFFINDVTLFLFSHLWLSLKQIVKVDSESRSVCNIWTDVYF